MANISREEITKTVDKAHILIVDDDHDIAKLLKNYLAREGFVTSSVDTVAAMRAIWSLTKFEAVILDVVLPDEDGWAALRWLRVQGDVPVVMLTGKGETTDKVVGLEMGADDYLSKPFDLRELLARLRTVLRRAVKAPSAPAGPKMADRVEFAEWVLDLASQQLKSVDGTIVHLTQAEHRILHLLVHSPRRVISRDQLMEAVTGRGWEPFDRSIDVHVSNLRRKLDSGSKLPSLIRTIRGSGYMFIPVRG